MKPICSVCGADEKIAALCEGCDKCIAHCGCDEFTCDCELCVIRRDYEARGVRKACKTARKLRAAKVGLDHWTAVVEKLVDRPEGYTNFMYRFRLRLALRALQNSRDAYLELMGESHVTTP